MTTLAFSAAVQSYVVPADCDYLVVELYGGKGGNYSTTLGGLGGYTKATVPVTPGETLAVRTGGQGQGLGFTVNPSLGGYNGGGTGFGTGGAGGGGASDLRRIQGLFNDDFNRADGAIGNGWTAVNGGTLSNIVSNRAQHATLFSGAIRDLGGGAVDQDVTVTCTSTGGLPGASFYANMSANGQNGVLLQFSGGALTIYSVVGNSATSQQTSSATFSGQHTIRIITSVTGTNISVIALIDGTEAVRATFTLPPLAGGYAGFAMGAGVGMDNFTGNSYSKLVVAGGGGGAGGGGPYSARPDGGAGGGLVAIAGVANANAGTTAGGGGTQSAGGAAGSSAKPGGSGMGGHGANLGSSSYMGGGGGAGYFGGGGGGNGGGVQAGAGGGGGSSYAIATASDISYLQGVNNTDGFAVLVPAPVIAPKGVATVTGNMGVVAGAVSTSAGIARVQTDISTVKHAGDIVLLPSTPQPQDITLETAQGPNSLASTSTGQSTVSVSMGSQQAVFSSSAGQANVTQSLGIGIHPANTVAAGVAGVSQQMLVIRSADFFTIYPSTPPYAPLDVLLAPRTGPPVLTAFAATSQGSATTTGSLTADNALSGTSNGDGTVVHTQPVPVEAASTGSSTATGDLTRHTLAASASSDAVVTGDLVLSVVFSGAISGTSTTNGNLAKIQILSSSSTATSTVTADLTYLRPLDVTITCTASTTGDLSKHVLRGSITGFATVAGNLGGSFTYEIYSNGTSAVTGTVGLAFTFNVTVTATGSVAGNMTFPRDLSTATSSGESTVVGNVLVYILSGQECIGTGSVSGHLRYLDDIVRLAATSTGSSDVVGADRLKFRFGNQSITGTATVTAQMRRMWPLDGTCTGSAVVTFDHLTVHTIPPGPVVCFATVVGEAIMDAKFGGTSSGVASLVINTYARYNLSTGTSNGVSTNHGRLGVHPQDFEVGPCDGSAAVHGQIRLSVLFLSGTSRGGRIPNLDGAGHETGFYNDTLATARLGITFAFPGPMRAVGTSEVEAILLLNDSGLIRGNSRIDASLARLSTEYSGIVTAFAKTLYAYLDRPGDMQADVNDAYAGVGRWYPGGTFFVQLYFYETDQMAPYKNVAPDFDTGASHRGDRFSIQHTNTERRNAHKWDGTYAPFTRAAAPNLPDNPWYVDPDQSGASPGNTRYLNNATPLPGALRRRYQLADPGELGGWFVDTVPFNYRDVAMRAGSVGEARFSEPQSTVDMDLELKSSMKGQIHGVAVVQALALLLSFRHIVATGNVTALRYLLKAYEGNVTKSQDTRLPITRKNSELIQPIHQTHALFV